ncbi:hypothetical protein RJ640_004700 [Escallonia rubra]|uniref:NADH dehydrogenase [ubiquinone] 1 alpha subcomplex subunit 12 n=1 Tax=Escallonia rubra TaxID=112253 RepID=A0AA88RIX0_9ASTE|nr:hypothetical protein RJ640_004700 [Escallonia rubra]
MSRLWGKIAGLFSARTFAGADKAGNRYFSRKEEIDGIQRNFDVKAVSAISAIAWCIGETLGEDGEADGILSHVVSCNVPVKEKRWVIFKGEDDPTAIPVEWICWLNGQRKIAPTPEEMAEMEARRQRVKLNVARKVGGPDLRSFVQQFPGTSQGDKTKETDTTGGMRTLEPTGSGQSFKPGTWQPPT